MDESRYPSPTDANNRNSNGPFYGPTTNSTGPPPSQDEVDDDLQLRADLERSLANEVDSLFHQQLPQGVLDLDQGSPGEIGPDGTSRSGEPRQKVSKACDVCRSKKVKCDGGIPLCSYCRKNNTPCTFARQQLKRGPNKGYIKQLADRLKEIEGRLPGSAHSTSQDEDSQPQEGFANYSAPGGAGNDRADIREIPQLAGHKRSHEAISQGQHQGPDEHNDNSRRPQAVVPSNASRAPQSFGYEYQAFFAAGAAPTRRNVDPSEGITDMPPISDWDDEVVDEYYRAIHQTFPLLSNSKVNLRRRLSTSPAGLREAFLTALGCYMRTFPSSNLRRDQSYAASMKRAGQLIADYPFDNPATHTIASNLVYLQTLLLMALESDNHGPLSVKGQAGPSRAEWLGRAAGVAGQLSINSIDLRDHLQGDPDNDGRLARRVWWVLFILDRWHASSTSDLLKLPENSIVLLPEDQILLGESTYHLARLSFIIGHIATIQTTTKTPETNVMAPTSPASYLLSLTLAGEIDRFRESVESVWGSLNLVHLSYHHCHLLIKRLNPSTEPTDLISHALKIATVLNHRQTPVTPLNHQFGALAAMTLCELVDLPYTRADAIKGLQQMSEALGGGRGLAGHVTDSTGWDHAIRLMVEDKRRRLDGEERREVRGRTEGNTAATAPSEGAGQKFDATRLTMYGYLTALGQGHFET